MGLRCPNVQSELFWDLGQQGYSDGQGQKFSSSPDLEYIDFSDITCCTLHQDVSGKPMQREQLGCLRRVFRNRILTGAKRVL